MKKLILVFIINISVIITAVNAIDKFGIQSTPKGEEIFESKGCTMCHDVDLEKTGPSLQNIAIYYLGDEDALVSYLKGEKNPIVYPQNASIMRPQLLKIKSLYEDEIRALARYIIETN